MSEQSVRPFKVLIVDDEPAARRGVAQLIEGDQDFDIVGECATGEAMVAAVRHRRPDLVFLDVQMPGLDGFGALAKLDAHPAPLVIFVTGYDRYAVRAFEARAIDYLLKPYSKERFQSACAHAKQQLAQRRQAEDGGYRERLIGLLEDITAATNRSSPRATSDAAEPVRFLVKKAPGRTVILSAHDILWIEARRDYVRLHTSDGHHLIRDTMANLEGQLDPTQFLRIHRSAIVKIDEITEIRNSPDEKLEVILSDGTSHAVSAGGRRLLHERLGFRV